MKKYRIQNCLSLLKSIRDNIEQIKNERNMEEKLRILKRAEFEAFLIYNTMRSLHD